MKEKKPSKEGQYLITYLDYGFHRNGVSIDYWDDLGEFWEYAGNAVVAWAELPEPYEANDGQDNIRNTARLINADELDIAIYESFVFGRLMEFEKGEKTIDETSDLIVEDADEAIKEQLKNAHTVDAIPVEWIKNFINRANDTDGYAVAEMLSDWETENESD